MGLSQQLKVALEQLKVALDQITTARARLVNATKVNEINGLASYCLLRCQHLFPTQLKLGSKMYTSWKKLLKLRSWVSGCEVHGLLECREVHSRRMDSVKSRLVMNP